MNRFARERGKWRERGSATTELVVMAPLLILLALVAVAFGRLAGARLDADEAAHQAARAASLARTADQARGDALRAARASLAGAGASCTGLRIASALGGLEPGGTVRVTVTCRADLDVPGMRSMDVTSTSTSVVDLYRGKPSEFSPTDAFSIPMQRREVQR
ncbi:TadE/TadG family type IV pilus assembly protein [Streptomyces sp. NPDC051561]|uniref:TadE/TadG family type IV pilus assembly protein n=1 Tax=Streptomyces sp. NPDC051561 TaxID=3365658 RepID=UPI0037A66937